METRSAKKKKLLNLNPPSSSNETSDDEDRISDLPDDILHHTFSFLPIKSIAQTSVLSNRWKNLWYSFPDLDFTTVNSPVNAVKIARSTLQKRVRSHVSRGTEYADQILAILEKHSDVRVLRFRAFLTFSGLSALIKHAIKHNVQTLDIDVSTCDYFNLPRSIINSRTLRSLRLKSSHPGFRLPPLELIRDGFRSLSTLSLSRLMLHDKPFLITLFTCSSFPLLKKLHLESCFGLKHLRIESPGLEELSLESCFQLQNLEILAHKLRNLGVSSCFDGFSVRSRVKIEAPILENLVWSCNAVTEECVVQDLNCLVQAFVSFDLLMEHFKNAAKIAGALNFLSRTSHCQFLTLENECIEILSKHNQFTGVSLSNFTQLKSLELCTGLNKHNNPGLATLFRTCPTIHTLTIKIINDQGADRRQWNKDLWQSTSLVEEERYWESQTHSLRPFLHHLKAVKIHGFTECASDISLVKFLLKNGKALQQVFICTGLSKPRDSILREKIKSQIMAISRASSNAKIDFH